MKGSGIAFMWKRRSELLLAILATVVFFTGLQGDFLGGHDGWCAARRAVAARNTLEMGWGETRLGMALNVGDVTAQEPKAYWHHPQGIHWLVSTSFALFGEGEWQARIVPTLLMCLNLYLYLLLTGRWFPGTSTWLRGLPFLAIPMLSYYGPFVAHQPLMLLAALLALWLFERRKEVTAPAIWKTMATGILGAFTAWPWFLFAGGLFLLGLPDRASPRTRAWLKGFAQGVLFGGILVAFHTWVQSSLGWSDLEALFVKRSTGRGITVWTLLAKMGSTWLELFNPVSVALSFAGILSWVTPSSNRQNHSLRVALLFAATGFGWAFLFKQGASVHEYWPWYAAPAFSILALHFFVGLSERLSPRFPRVGTLVFIGILLTMTLQGLGTTVGRHLHPSPSHPEWSDGYFSSQVGAWKRLRSMTEPSTPLLLHSSILPSGGRAQFRFYANRSHQKLKKGEAFRLDVSRLGNRVAAIDLKAVSTRDVKRVRKQWMKHFDVDQFGTVLIAQVPKGETPTFTAWCEIHPKSGWLTRWMHPTQLPSEWRPSPILTAETQRQLGIIPDMDREEFLRLQSSKSRAYERSEQIAMWNLGLYFGSRMPDETVDAIVDSFAQGEVPPMQWGQEVELRVARVRYTWQRALSTDLLFQIQGEVSANWKPTLKRVFEGNSKRKRASKSLPVSLNHFGKEWLPGELVHIHQFVPLPKNRDGDDVRVRFALWSGAKGKRSRYLEPEGQSHYVELKPENGPWKGVWRWLELEEEP